MGPEQALVGAVLPRRTWLAWRAAGSRDQAQRLADNVDVAFLVCALDALRRFLRPGATVAWLGSSGVGKSTIVNRLLNQERFLTREVPRWDSCERHATVRRELAPLPCTGALIGTPGMRELQLWAGPESIDAVADNITAIAENPRFRDCTRSGEPSCAMAAALD